LIGFLGERRDLGMVPAAISLGDETGRHRIRPILTGFTDVISNVPCPQKEITIK